MSPSPPETTAGSKNDPLLKRVIAGNFRIDKLIGAGAMGNVYKAEQISLGKAVAVKVLHTHLMNDDKLVMRFKREAKNASLLNHPNSIQIIDSGQDHDGTLFIAMELLAGRDLAQVIRDDFPLPLLRIARIMSQTLSALDEAHVQGVVHRDLKPSNIMLIEQRGVGDFVKVCDFGIAKATQDAKDDREAMLTIQGLVCGTPEYMAPEQARGEPLDGRADLYAAAVILYQMVTGDIPFRGESPMAIVSRHLAEPPIIPSRKRPDLPISPALDALILRGMEKNRDMRFASAAAFREELEVVAYGGTDRFTPPPSNPGLLPATGRIPVAGDAATVVAGERAPNVFGSYGSTTRLIRSRQARPLAALAVLIALGTAAAYAFIHGRPGTAAGGRASSAAIAVPAPPVVTPLAPPTSAALPPPGVAPAPPETGSPTPPSHAAASRGATASVTDRAPAGPARGGARRKRGVDRAPATAPGLSAEGGASAGGAVAAKPPAAGGPTPPAEEAAGAPSQRGAREIVTEAEKLLAQGEVTDACARGEEAARVNSKHALAYRFLGKCYMRAGDAGRANGNYKRYLELSPNAPDAMFIKSIIK